MMFQVASCTSLCRMPRPNTSKSGRVRVLSFQHRYDASWCDNCATGSSRTRTMCYSNLGQVRGFVKQSTICTISVFRQPCCKDIAKLELHLTRLIGVQGVAACVNPNVRAAVRALRVPRTIVNAKGSLEAFVRTATSLHTADDTKE
jgi:hypothetical protein